MDANRLKDFLSKSNEQLLHHFCWGNEGERDFGRFMTLVRQQQAEIERLNRAYEVLEEMMHYYTTVGTSADREIARLAIEKAQRIKDGEQG